MPLAIPAPIYVRQPCQLLAKATSHLLIICTRTGRNDLRCSFTALQHLCQSRIWTLGVASFDSCWRWGLVAPLSHLDRLLPFFSSSRALTRQILARLTRLPNASSSILVYGQRADETSAVARVLRLSHALNVVRVARPESRQRDFAHYNPSPALRACAVRCQPMETGFTFALPTW